MRTGVLGAAVLLGVACTPLSAPGSAHADALGYLVNITVRPGYTFASADAAVAYGYGICDRVSRGTGYRDVVATVKTDLASDDDYQAGYLIGQAVDELCPAQIWQLRRSAAGYTGGLQVDR